MEPTTRMCMLIPKRSSVADGLQMSTTRRKGMSAVHSDDLQAEIVAMKKARLSNAEDEVEEDSD